MKLTLVCAIFLLASPAATLAQSGSDWSGFYAGGNASVTSGDTNAAATLSVTQISNLAVPGRGLIVVPGTTASLAASRRRTSWSGGGQFGYNWQHDKFVIGPEFDVSPFH